MGMTDLEALLRPVSDDARCGPDLDAAGDPAYVELGVAAEWKEAKDVGEQEGSAAAPPDWKKLKETASALLAVSKDLRIAKHYVAGLAHTEGPPGAAPRAGRRRPPARPGRGPAGFRRGRAPAARPPRPVLGCRASGARRAGGRL